MVRTILIAGGLLGGALLLAGAAGDPAKTTTKAAAAAPAAKDPMQAEVLQRGAYLVTVGGCNDCHTPLKMGPFGPVPDMTRMLSGHQEGAPDPSGTLGKTDIAMTGSDLTAWKQPFGLVYARNLTPDKTGLGDWTEQQFVTTLRTGRHQGDGRPLLSPMPWFNYAMMTDADLHAVWTFLRSIPAVKNTVPDPKVPPPVFEQFAKANAATLEMLKGAKR